MFDREIKANTKVACFTLLPHSQQAHKVLMNAIQVLIRELKQKFNWAYLKYNIAQSVASTSSLGFSAAYIFSDCYFLCSM